jgi:hypothetical protein
MDPGQAWPTKGEQTAGNYEKDEGQVQYNQKVRGKGVEHGTQLSEDKGLNGY